MDLFFLSNTALFRGAADDEIGAMLQCLGSYTRSFDRGETVCRAGETVDSIGLVLSGSVLIECCDLWGNNSVLGSVEAGQLFSEAYAFLPGEPLMVSVTARERSEILFLNAARLVTTCPSSCAHHSRLIRSLLQIFAQKNLNLSRRVLHTSPKSIRGRLLSYLSQQAKQSGSGRFEIPFNRQQLADYLGVDRSALSNELSKMRGDGLLDFERNTFKLNAVPEGGRGE